MAATKTRGMTTAEQQMAAKRKPQTIDDLSPDEELTPDEEAALEETSNASGPSKLAQAMNPKSAVLCGDKLPDWVVLPPDLRIPKGVEVGFFKITDRSDQERIVVVWELSVRDERMARARTMGDYDRTTDESTKQMIRAIDGVAVPEANPLVLERFWDELQAKHRGLLKTWFLKAHQLSPEERVDFFTSRVASRRAV